MILLGFVLFAMLVAGWLVAPSSSANAPEQTVAAASLHVSESAA